MSKFADDTVAVFRSALAKFRDAESIIGAQFAGVLEEQDAKDKIDRWLQVKNDGQPDAAALVTKDKHGDGFISDEDARILDSQDQAIGTPGPAGPDENNEDIGSYAVNWSMNSEGGYKAIGAGDRRADLTWLQATGFVELRLLDGTGKPFTLEDRGLPLLTYEEAEQIAAIWLSGQSGGFVPVEEARVILRDGPQTTEVDNMAEKLNPKTAPTGAAGATPGIAALARATTVGAVKPAPAPAPVQRAAPAPRAIAPGTPASAITPDVLADIVRQAVAPIHAELEDLKARSTSAPVGQNKVKMEVRTFSPGGFGRADQIGMTGVKQGYSVKSLVRRSVGLSLDSAPVARKALTPREAAIASTVPSPRPGSDQTVAERAAMTLRTALSKHGLMQPVVFRSRYMREMSFATEAARDGYDASYDGSPYAEAANE